MTREATATHPGQEHVFTPAAPTPGLVRRLAWLALAGQVVFIASWIVAGVLEPGYSHLEEGVSALSARDAEHGWIVAGGLVVMGLTLAALGPALVVVLAFRPSTRLAAAALLIAGTGIALTGLLPIDCSLAVDERCRRLSDAGALSWQHYAHLWLGLLIQASLAVSALAVVRSLWPRPAAIALLTGTIPAVLFGIASIPLHGIDATPDGLIQRVGWALVHLWVLLVAGGVLHATRPAPPMPEPAPLRPREFFGGTWTGEGQLLLLPALVWRRFSPRFRASRDVTWLSDEAFVVEDRAEFGKGHREVRRRFCELVAPDRFRVTSTDLIEPTEVWIDENGFRVAPYRVRVPYGPVGITLRCRDELRLEADRTLVDEIEMRFLGVPVVRVVVRARPVDSVGGASRAASGSASLAASKDLAEQGKTSE